MIETQIGLSIGNILTVIGGFGIVFAGFYKLLSKRFDGIDKKFDIIDKKFEALEIKFGEKLDRLETKLSEFAKDTEHRFGKIETRLSVIENEQKNTNQRLSTIESYIAPRKVYEFKEPKHEEEPKEN